MMTPPVEQTNELAELRGEVADLRKRVAAVESLLTNLYGPACLGAPRPAAPPPEPERRMRPIGTIGGNFYGR